MYMHMHHMYKYGIMMVGITQPHDHKDDGTVLTIEGYEQKT